MSLYITIYICRGVYMYTRKSLVLIYGIRNPPIILRMLGKAMTCIYIAIGNRLMITAAPLKDIECLEKVGLQWKATELIRFTILRIHSEERLQIAGPFFLAFAMEMTRPYSVAFHFPELRIRNLIEGGLKI